MRLCSHVHNIRLHQDVKIKAIDETIIEVYQIPISILVMHTFRTWNFIHMHKIAKPFHENKKHRTLDDNIDEKPKCCYLFSAIGGGMQQKENNKG